MSTNTMVPVAVASGDPAVLTERLSAELPGNRKLLDALRLHALGGEVLVYWTRTRVFVDVEAGGGVHAEILSGLGRVAALPAKRGIRGTVGELEVTIRRPKFGLRLKNRTVVLDAGEIGFSSRMTSPRRFSIHRTMDDSTVLVYDRGAVKVERSLTPTELAALLLFEHCGIIQSSAISTFISI